MRTQGARMNTHKLYARTNFMIYGICHLRSIYAQHGIPHELMTDNGCQFMSQEFQQFLQDNNTEHTISSPLFPQANGMTECGV